MNIERVIAKFDLKGINYEPSKGGKALMTLEEYLATVGIAWKQSPVGFLVLFVECLNDAQSAKQLFKATMIEANEIMKTWRGTYPDKALNALCITAIAEATQPLGQICPECNGSGKVRSKCNHSVKCPCCDDGRIQWTQETRFAYFCLTLRITYSRFRRYMPVIKALVDWLSDKRNAAALAVQGSGSKEESLVAC